MTALAYILEDEEQTQAFAKYFSLFLKSGLVIGLVGEIGMGKTCLVRATLQALGVRTHVKSPTFNLVESYLTELANIYHFDLYRLNDALELEELGFRDYLASDTICLVEWPEKAPSLWSVMDVLMEFSFYEMGRRLHLKAMTPTGEQLLAALQREPWLGG